MMIISGVVALSGVGLAYLLHLHSRATAERFALKNRLLADTLENKYWVDEIYDAVIVRPVRGFGVVLFWIDRNIVDRMVWLVGFIPQFSGFLCKWTTQRGQLQGYALSITLGIVIILLLVMLST